MPRYFIIGGNYFEASSDVQEWDDDRISVPQRPDVNHTWDGAQWVDGGPNLQEQRSGASMPKTAFCLKLRALGVLPIGEASAAARGEWPATFAGFTSGLPADQAEDAKIEWAGALNINYGHPLLQGLALTYAAGDQTAATAILDQIFGVA